MFPNRDLSSFASYRFHLFLPPDPLPSSELVAIFPIVSTPCTTPLTAFPTPRLIPLVPFPSKLRLLPTLILRIFLLFVVGLPVPFVLTPPTSPTATVLTCLGPIGDELSEE